MKPLLLLALTLFFALPQFTKAEELSAEEKAAIKTEIDQMMDLFEKGDTAILFKKTHQSIYKLTGGEAQFEELVNTTIKQLMDSGIKYGESELSDPGDLYDAGDCELCFVPRTASFEIQGQQVKTIGFMIAIRDKGQEEWKYLDGAGLRQNPELLSTLFPNLQEGFVLPENKIVVGKQ